MKSVVFGSILNSPVQIRLHGRLVAEPPKEARLKTSHNYFKKNQGQGQDHLYLPAQFNSMYEFPCDAKLHVEHYLKMPPWSWWVVFNFYRRIAATVAGSK